MNSLTGYTSRQTGSGLRWPLPWGPSQPHSSNPPPHPLSSSLTDTTGVPDSSSATGITSQFDLSLSMSPSEVPGAQGWGCPTPGLVVGWALAVRSCPVVTGTSASSWLPSPPGATSPGITLIVCAHKSAENSQRRVCTRQLPGLLLICISESNRVSLCPQTVHTTAPTKFLPRIPAPNYTSKKRTNREMQRFIGCKLI